MRLHFAERGMCEPLSLGAALETGKKVPPDITALLMEDHRVVTAWFDWYAAELHPGLRRMVLTNILTALKAHMAMEEEVFYPAAARALGDDRLVERAVAEHESAKDIMRRLGEEEDAALVEQLRAEIAQHIIEEEGQIFPLVREAGMDLYGIGSLCAAIRVERLFSFTGRDGGQFQKETAAMPVSQEEARHFLIVGLRNIHAAVRQGRTMVNAQLSHLENYPELAMKLESHLEEKDQQLARVEQILQSLGESPSTFKDLSMAAMGSLSSTANSMANDEILKNSFATFGMANFEAAAYETLILFAEILGAREALPLLQQSLSEERAMASFIAENLRGTGLRFLQLRTEGRTASH